jgi:hypothetical protein
VVQLFKIKCFQKLPKNQKNRKKLASRTPTFAQRMKASRADLNSRRPSPHAAYHACRSHAPPTDLFSATQKTSILYISDPGCTFFVNIFLVNYTLLTETYTCCGIYVSHVKRILTKIGNKSQTCFPILCTLAWMAISALAMVRLGWRRAGPSDLEGIMASAEISDICSYLMAAV